MSGTIRLLIISLAGIGSLLVSSNIQASIEQQRAIFQEASFALETNQIVEYNRLLEKLDDYPVKAYLEYDALKRGINQASKQEVSSFLDDHQDYPFNYHLRSKWLSTLAKRRDWEGYLTFFDDRSDSRFQCLAFQAHLSIGADELINERIKKVWLSGYSQPAACDEPFKYLLDTYPHAEQIIWLRIDRAFKAGRPNLARWLGKKLKPEDFLVVNTWYQAHRQPEKTLKSLLQSKDNTQNRKIIVHAIDRLARKDSLSASSIWNEFELKFEFSEDQRNQLRQRIALSSAYQHQPVAKQLLSALPLKLKNDGVYLWLARIHLRGQDWQGLINTIEQMPPRLKQENEWQYWLARSYESLGYDVNSKGRFLSLANKSTYYGFLAADKLQIPYRIEQESAATVADFDEDQFLANNHYLLRARELYFLDRHIDARREWFQALRRLNTRQIKQAAALASSWKWHDSAIKTVAKTTHRSDYSLRFPTPFRQQVFSHADAKQLDPSVIYGVMRRESLFDPMARSKVGALGLMQLMPSTARLVAKSLGLKRPRQSDILKIENNINLGTQYFKSVLNRFENNVSLAAAAYNAGPLNVKNWLPQEGGMPADLWIETVPFKETRNYVQAVLAYATVFDKSLGSDTLISSRMHDIKSEY